MDANRYFEEMHKAMSAHRAGSKLLFTVKYQDNSSGDAYIELWQNPDERCARVVYSTVGRKQLNFQLFRTGWQLCHNEAGEMTGSFPKSADNVISSTDFRTFCREEALDAAKTSRIVHELTLHSGAYIYTPAAQSSRIVIDSYVGAGAHWAYSGEADEACAVPAAILYWLADFLAGSERRALQADIRAERLAAQWEMDIEFSASMPLSRQAFTPGRTRSQAYAARARVPGKNERWQSFLTVMAAV